MSDLQIGLIVLGVALIGVVLGFNWWQDRRVSRRMETHFPSGEHDPLLGEGRSSEPRVAAASAAAGTAPATTRREPGMTAAEAEAEAAAQSSAAHQDADDVEEPDPAVEAVIEVVFGNPVRGADLIPYLSSLRSVGRKTIRVFGQTDGQRHRARLHGVEHYARLQLAVLLANRDGALSAIEWSQAWARAQDLAERFDALVEGPEQQPVLDQAARLDEVCAALDMQVGLTLILGCAQPAGEVLAIAREMGFVHDGPRLAWMSDEGIARFTMARPDGAPFDAGVGGVSKLNLLLDVPCSPSDDRAFGRMVDVGLDLASRLRAELVDDQGRPVHAGADESIDARLRTLYGHLDQSGLRSASPRALRVFS